MDTINRIEMRALMRNTSKVVVTGLALAVTLACSGAKTEKPVLTSNQALVWHALRTSGFRDSPPGLGSLFQH